MSALDMLDVAIGLVFLYLIMSLACSAAVEFLEVLLQYRSRDLERGIKELLGDEAEAKKLYDHPLIRSLFAGEYHAGGAKGWKNLFWKWQLPSYIPSRAFALAVMDMTKTISGATPKTDGTTVTMTNPATPSEQAVAALLSAAGGNAEKLRENVEEWFNSSMDRVSGWYKRRTQLFLLAVGMAVAVWLNVDSLEVAKRLARDKPLRETIVKQATAYAEAHAKGLENGKPPANIEEAKKNFDAAKTELMGLGLPIGRADSTDFELRTPKIADINRFFGWLITACAVALGAPFWFDILNKIIVVRSTVKPKEKSGTEGSKDPK